MHYPIITTSGNAIIGTFGLERNETCSCIFFIDYTISLVQLCEPCGQPQLDFLTIVSAILAETFISAKILFQASNRSFYLYKIQPEQIQLNKTIAIKQIWQAAKCEFRKLGFLSISGTLW